jgi:hypothetical protein
MEERTEFTNASLSALFSNFPFHLDNFAATLSISVCSSSLLMRPICSGNQRYLYGRLLSPAWKWPKIADTWMSSQHIENIFYFCIFLHNPVAAPNECSNCCKCATSVAIGLRNKTISSAPIGCRRPICVALSNNLCRGSIARMNNIGKSGVS